MEPQRTGNRGEPQQKDAWAKIANGGLQQTSPPGLQLTHEPPQRARHFCLSNSVPTSPAILSQAIEENSQWCRWRPSWPRTGLCCPRPSLRKVTDGLSASRRLPPSSCVLASQHQLLQSKSSNQPLNSNQQATMRWQSGRGTCSSWVGQPGAVQSRLKTECPSESYSTHPLTHISSHTPCIARPIIAPRSRPHPDWPRRGRHDRQGKVVEDPKEDCPSCGPDASANRHAKNFCDPDRWAPT